MFVIQLVFTLLMALVFTLVFAVGLRRTGPWSNVLAFFAVVFLAAWAGGLWISPAGPVFMGIYWLPIVLIPFLVGLLLAAVPPQPPRHVETISEAEEQAQQHRAAVRVFDAFFWMLLVGFTAVIVLGYLL